MATAFATPGNNVSTTIGSTGYDHTVTPKVINLATGGGAKFPALPSPNTYNWYYRVTVCQVAFAYSPTASTSNYTVFSATGKTGDQLTGVTLSTTEPDTQTDRDYAVGDIVEVRVTAGTLSDVQKAVNALEAGGGGLAIGSTVVSGTASSVLYVDSGGYLAQNNAKFNWNDSAQTLTVTSSTGQTPFSAVNDYTSAGPVTAYFTRTHSGAQNLINFTSSYTSASNTDPIWGMGVGGGQHGYEFNVWNGSTVTQYIYIQTPTEGNSVVLGASQNVTIDSSGYLSILTGSGAPGGSPATGALYLDTTNFKLYGRCGSSWKSVTLA